MAESTLWFWAGELDESTVWFCRAVLIVVVPICAVFTGSMWYNSVVRLQESRRRQNKERLSTWGCLMKTHLEFLDIAVGFLGFLVYFKLRSLPGVRPLPAPGTVTDESTGNLEILVLMLWVGCWYLGFRAFRYWRYRIHATNYELNQPSVFKRLSFWLGDQ